MHDLTSVWLTGCVATAATATSTIFNGILAVNNSSNIQLALGLRAILFVALGFSFLGTLFLVYFTGFYVRNVKQQTLRLVTPVWTVFGMGVGVVSAALVLSLVTLIWSLVQQQRLPENILNHSPVTWLAVWFGCWGWSLLSQLALFITLGRWTKELQRTQPTDRLDIDSGARLTPTTRQSVIYESRSLNSRDTTLAEPPQTPTNKRPGSSRPGSSGPQSMTMVPPPVNSRMYLVGHNRSAQSSLDLAFPAGEATSIDNAFDRWDTSSVHSEMRAAVGSVSAARPGLETIPGSRPESPEDAVDGPFLPSSPQERAASPKAISSDTATVLGDWSSSPSRYIPTSSPPSSPPNFSRPTSKHKNQPLMVIVEPSMQDIIHPLFRTSSPQPPPIATSGTIITASPMANQPITPRTLANLRSHNKSSSAVNSQSQKLTGHWRAMPSVSQTSERRPSTSGSLGPGSPQPGSPGPSIADEDELPPILPGFVLSAGQRSSMLGYASRKSLRRDRRGSQMSTGN